MKRSMCKHHPTSEHQCATQ